jgi:hypothetical protein
MFKDATIYYFINKNLIKIYEFIRRNNTPQSRSGKETPLKTDMGAAVDRFPVRIRKYLAADEIRFHPGGEYSFGNSAEAN